jgi:tetratricopeptide (TPR) repeat protein
MERQIRNAVDAGEGDFEIRRLRALVAANPDLISERLQLARAYRDRGYPDLTVEHCRLAASRFPDDADTQLLLARTLREMDLRAEAGHGLEAFLNAHPGAHPQLAAWLGIIRDEIGEWSQGESAHRAALAILPGAAWLHNNLGYNLLRQGRNDEAAEQFRMALRLDSSSVRARNNLGLAVASKPEEAVLQWQSVSDPATAHSNLAAVLIEQGRFEEARHELAVALGYNGSHPAALKNLRLVAQLDGKPATLQVAQQESRRSRWKAVRRILLGTSGEKL